MADDESTGDGSGKETPKTPSFDGELITNADDSSSVESTESSQESE